MNKINPLVSICMPTHNSSEFIEETLCCLINQTYKNLEIIIVDDHSIDNTIRIIEEYQKIDNRIRLFRNKGKGACAARNYAFEQSKGEYIMFFDSDDLINDSNIESHILYHKSRPIHEDSISFSLLTGFKSSYNIPTPSIRNINHNFENGYELVRDMFLNYQFNTTICYITKRSLIEKSGLWNETLLKNQDGEFFSRLLINTEYTGCVKNAKAYWRERPNSISHTKNLNTINSTFNSIKIISNLLLSKDTSYLTKYACAYNLSHWMYDDFPNNKTFIKECNDLLNKWGFNFIYPYNKGNGVILNKLFGWKLTKYITSISKFGCI